MSRLTRGKHAGGSNGLQNIGSSSSEYQQFPNYPSQRFGGGGAQFQAAEPEPQAQFSIAGAVPIGAGVPITGSYGSQFDDDNQQFMSNFNNFRQTPTPPDTYQPQQQQFLPYEDGNLKLLRQLYEQHPGPGGFGSAFCNNLAGQYAKQINANSVPDQFPSFMGAQNTGYSNNFYSAPMEMPMSPGMSPQYSAADKVSHTQYSQPGLSYRY